MLSGPAATWIAKLPEGIPRLQEHLSLLKTPIAGLQRILQQAEHVTGQAAGVAAAATPGGSGLLGILLAGTRDLADALFTTLLLLFFLLLSGDTFLRRLVEILPNSATSKLSTMFRRISLLFQQ
jgi:predicted PurR-regulated permease PerM